MIFSLLIFFLNSNNIFDSNTLLSSSYINILISISTFSSACYIYIYIYIYIVTLFSVVFRFILQFV